MMRTFPARVWDEHDMVGIIQFPNKVDMFKSPKNCENVLEVLCTCAGACEADHYVTQRIFNKRKFI